MKQIKKMLFDRGFTRTPKFGVTPKGGGFTPTPFKIKGVSLQSRRGFTLIELLVVVAIISILASVVLASLNTAREKSRDVQRIANVNQIANAIALYQNDNGGLPPGEDGVEYVNGNPNWIPGLAPKYISSVPSDPIDADEHKFHYSRNGNDYEIISFLEQNGTDAACGDGGSSCQYYEKASDKPLVLVNPGVSGWHFASSTEIVFMTCPNSEEQVIICHRPSKNSDSGQTLTVSCNAIGPEGHSNHENDTLGACSTEVIPPPSPTPETTLIAPAGFSMSSKLPSTNLYSGYLSFSWTTQRDVAGYRIYLTNTATNVTTTLNFSPANASGVGNFGYAQGVQYSAYIVSVDSAGNISAPSATLYATTLKLTSPKNFTVSTKSPTSVSLAWTASEGIIYKYMITRYTGSVGNAEKIVEVLAPATSYVDTTVEPGITYIYWIKAMSLENYAGFNIGTSTTTPTS